MKINKVFEKVNNLSPAAKASFWFVVSSIVLKGISFITTPIFTRVMEVADYGSASVFVTWENVISIFATLSLSGGVYNVAMTKFEKDVPSYTSSMLTLTALCTAITYTFCLLINVFAPSVFELNNAYLIFMALQTFLNAVTAFWLMQKRYSYKYKSVIAYTLSNAILGPVFALIAITLFPQNKAFAKVIGNGLPGILIGIVILIITYRKGKKFVSKKYWKYALNFNMPLLPHYFASIVLSASDKLMINSMVSSAHAGIYSIAYSICSIINIVMHSINNSMIPYTLQSIKKQNFKGLKKTINLCLLLMSAICVMVVMFAKEGIMIFATKSYLEASKFIVPLTFAVLIEFLIGIVGNIVFYYEKTVFMSRATIISALINIVLNYFGIKYFGYIAAGYVTAFSGFVKFILYYKGAKKYEKNLASIIDIKVILAIFVVYMLFAVYSIVFANSIVMRGGFLMCLLIATVLMRDKIITLIRNLKTSEE